jgi:penicillin-binding protein 1A
VWVGFDDKQISLGKKETGARAALPIWLEFMKAALEGQPALDFANVVTLEQQALEHKVNVDTPDTAPETDEPAAPKEKPPVVTPPTKTTTAPTASNISPGL